MSVGFVFTAMSVQTKANESSNFDSEIKTLLTKYYNNGTYIKESQISLNDKAVSEGIQFFHAKSTELNRTTFYKGDALWMSRGIKDEYSYYGTTYEGETAIGVTNATTLSPLTTPDDAQVVLSGNGKESMENYYVTMFDFINLTYESDWEVNNGVYTYKPSTISNNDAIFTNFRLFTAPCYLEPTEENINYLTFTKATLSEVNNTLILSLYVSSGDSGKVTSTVEQDGTYLFSQAKITASSDFVGTGTESDPYIIYDHATWSNYSTINNNKVSDFNGKYFKVVKDFKINGIYKIGRSDLPFAGIFDGNEHTISYNFTFDKGSANQGLFGTISNTAIIRNIKVAGTIDTLNTGTANIGSIVGVNKGIIENCESFVSINAAGYNVGGLVGVSDGGKIKYSTFNGTITSSSTAKGNTDHGIGGIVGYLSVAGVTTIDNCVNNGTINTGSTQVGGVVGLAKGTSSIRHTISNCENTGAINSTASVNSTTNEGVAGIVGMAVYTNISTCANNGNITAKTACQVAGIAGKCCDSSTINSSVNNGTIIGIAQVGGIAGRHVGNAIIDGCTNNGNIYCTSTATTYGQIYGQNGATVTNCTENGTVGKYNN